MSDWARLLNVVVISVSSTVILYVLWHVFRLLRRRVGSLSWVKFNISYRLMIRKVRKSGWRGRAEIEHVGIWAAILSSRYEASYPFRKVDRIRLDTLARAEAVVWLQEQGIEPDKRWESSAPEMEPLLEQIRFGRKHCIDVDILTESFPVEIPRFRSWWW